MVYQNFANSQSNLESFPLSKRPERRKIKDLPDYGTLLAWTKDKNITLEDAIYTDQARYDLLWLIWVYQDVRKIHLKDILYTDLITYQIKLRKKTKINNAKYKKL